MKAIELHESVETIYEALDLTRVATLLQIVLGENPDRSHRFNNLNWVEILLDSSYEYRRLREDPQASLILDQTNIDRLYQPDVLAHAISCLREQDDPETARGDVELTRALRSIETVGQLHALLTWAAEGRVGALPAGETRLDLEIVDFGRAVELPRMLAALTAVQDVAEILINTFPERPAAKFHVELLDSGSPLLIGLSAATDLSKLVAGALNWAWRSLVLMDHTRYERDLKAVGSMIDVFSKLDDAAVAGTISEEEASGLKHRLKASLEEILENGAALRTDLDAEGPLDTRRLLRETKGVRLLPPGATDDEEVDAEGGE